jgi:hypothetical protein
MSQDSQNDKGSSIRIPKLKSQGDNYVSWSKMMILLLKSKGLWKYVKRQPRTGEKNAPGTPTEQEVKEERHAKSEQEGSESEQEQPKFKTFDTNKTSSRAHTPRPQKRHSQETEEEAAKKDVTALLLLITHSAEAIHADLYDAKSSTEGWLKLKEKYTKSGIERSMWIRNEITRQRLRDHPDMDRFLTKLQSLHSELRAAGGGDTMSDAALTLHALSNLTPVYDTYKVFPCRTFGPDFNGLRSTLLVYGRL